MSDNKAELPLCPENPVRGEVVLGTRDPRILTESEFYSSRGLLYHGAATDFTYSPSGEFDTEDTGSDYWHDYGEGFYTTDDLNQARNYSLERSSQGTNTPVVYTFLPYQARMMDVRGINNTQANGTLSRAFVEDWLNYLESYLNNDGNFSKYNEFLKDVYQVGTRDFFLYRVRDALQKNKAITIRGSKYPGSAGIFRLTGNGFVSPIFRDFMLSKGYDGMVYREGGEGKAGEDLTGYVFYNPQVVDTWEGWQKRDKE